jgi:hypothetical protein
MSASIPPADCHDDTAAGLARLRREVRLLQVYAGGMTLAAALLVLCGAEAVRQKPKFAEIDVERVNVVEKDGRLRLVLTNRERAPDVITDGKTFKPRRGGRPAGMYFFADRGECGGLVFGTEDGPKDGSYHAGSALLFDQYRQDQTVGIMYDDQSGQRTAGLHVWDRPDTPLWKLAEKLEAIDKMPDGPAKQEALKEVRESSPSATRVFVGKSRQRAAQVVLADGKGRPRIRLSVDAEGAAGIEFLDEAGKVVRRLAPEEKAP